MVISVFLTDKLVECFKFNNSNALRLKKLIPDAEIIICNDEDSFKKSLIKTDIAFVWYFKQEWFGLAPKLKWIATPAAGKDYFHVSLPLGVIKTHGAFHGIIMAETVLAMMLCLARGTLQSFKLQKEIMWPRKELELSMNTLRGANLLIIGFGSIGSHIGHIAKSFGMKIIGIKRTKIKKPEYFDRYDKIETVDKLNDVLPEADHIALALPAIDSTDNILNSQNMRLVKKTAYIYNIGRGNAIDETALADCLKKNDIGGAFLDVFKNEPLPMDSPLRDCPNLYIMPHASAIAPQYMDLFVDEFFVMYKKWIKKK